jgi:hypothetical protein
VSRAVPLLLFSAIVVFSIDPPLVFLALENRAARREVLNHRADPWPELAAFLAGVRERTKKGDSIVLLLPVGDRQSYDHGYFRASYLLAGRTLLRPSRENVARADYVAAWRVNVPGDAVWRDHGGALLRRR